MRQAATLFFFVCFALLALIMGAQDFVDTKTVLFALALEQHDLQIHQPPPPGFYLYVWVGRLLHGMGIPVLWALHLTGLLFVLTTALCLGKLAHRAYGRGLGPLVLWAFLASPLVLHDSLRIGLDASVMLVSTLLAWIAYRVLHGEPEKLRLLAFLNGFAAAISPVLTLAFLPLLVYVHRFTRLTLGDKIVAWLACLAGFACWLLPQIDAADGLPRYLANVLQRHQGHTVVEALLSYPQAFWQAPLQPALHLLFGLGLLRLGWLLCLGLSTRVPAFVRTRAGLSRAFVLVWLLPPAVLSCFLLPWITAFAAVFPGLLILLSRYAAVHLQARRPGGQHTAAWVALMILLAEVVLFFVAPAVESYPGFSWQRARHGESNLQPTAEAFRGLPHREDYVLVGCERTQLAALVAPHIRAWVFDARRPLSSLAYSRRRARAKRPAELGPQSRWLLVEGPERLAFVRGHPLPGQGPFALPQVLKRHYDWVQVGTSPFEATYDVPAGHRTPGGTWILKR